MPQSTAKKFIQTESSAGILLFFFALIALIWDNSPWSAYYGYFLTYPLSLHVGPITLSKPILLWINDGMMTLFFLLVGLEIKRELFDGELNSIPKAMLPAVAAAGGMIAPAIMYALFNYHKPELLRGWAIPTATDIAFSLGILALLKNKIPSSLKTFLTAVAIFDDIGAILIIAVFYTHHISMTMLSYAGLLTLLLILLNRLNICIKSIYFLIGAIMWFCVLKSGVHATLVGIIVAFCIPLQSKKNKKSPVRDCEHRLHPWVAFLILPIFALANAGVSFAGFHSHMLLSSIPLGIFLGLFIGKQLGIFSATYIAIRCNIARIPTGCNLIHIYGVALLAGVGFTMSLFIGTLAFSDDYMSLVRIGVLSGSFISGLSGYILLKYFSKTK